MASESPIDSSPVDKTPPKPLGQQGHDPHSDNHYLNPEDKGDPLIAKSPAKDFKQNPKSKYVASDYCKAHPINNTEGCVPGWEAHPTYTAEGYM